MAKVKKPTPWDVKLDQSERETLAGELCREVRDALEARGAMINAGGMIDLWDWYYEQGRSDPNDRPFPGAADLTSYFIYENVSAERARLMKAVFGVKPFCFVEGWGPDAQKAPFVEAFHDWQVRKSGLRIELSKTIHGALIEDGYVLEVSEKVETRRITESLDAALDISSGGPVFTDGQPQLVMDEYGDPVPAQPGEPSAKVERTQTKTKRLGPQYTPISMKDYVHLPGHATHPRKLWGYAYRCWDRVPELQEKVKDGIYDKDAVAVIGEESDRSYDTGMQSADVAAQIGPAVEKELFQISLKRDLDGDGREEWYIATVSLPHQQLLRLKLDTFAMKLGRSRCVFFNLYPRRDSVYGYSYAGSLETLAEEHTGQRNNNADRRAIKTNAPMTVLSTALWDPAAEPFGAGRTITVRDHNEIKQLLVEDVSPQAVQAEAMLHQAKERVGGLSDNFIGLLSSQERTLGENRLAAGGSAVRVDEVVGHLHDAIAQVMELTHAIWIETLESDPKGIAAPSKVVDAMSAQGLDLNGGRFTLEQLKGDFAFEPYGSDNNANPEHQLAKFNAGIESLANLAKLVPAFQVMFQDRDVAQAILQQWARVNEIRDMGPFMKALNAPPPMMPATAGPGAGAPMGVPPTGDPMIPAAPGAGGVPPIAALLASLHGGGAQSVQ